MNLKYLVKDFHIYAFCSCQPLIKTGVRNLLNTRPDLEGVEKAAVFLRVVTIILFFGVTNRGRFFLCFVLFKERLDFFLVGIF